MSNKSAWHVCYAKLRNLHLKYKLSIFKTFSNVNLCNGFLIKFFVSRVVLPKKEHIHAKRVQIPPLPSLLVFKSSSSCNAEAVAAKTPRSNKNGRAFKMNMILAQQFKINWCHRTDSTPYLTIFVLLQHLFIFFFIFCTTLKYPKGLCHLCLHIAFLFA